MSDFKTKINAPNSLGRAYSARAPSWIWRGKKGGRRGRWEGRGGEEKGMKGKGLKPPQSKFSGYVAGNALSCLSRPSIVCLSPVTLLRPTQRVELCKVNLALTVFISMSFSFQNFGTWPIYDMIFFRYMICCRVLYLYPTVGTVLIHSVKPELTE